MKKRIVLLLSVVIALMFVFGACSSDKATDGNATNGNITDTDTSTEEALNKETTGYFEAFETLDMDGKKAGTTAFQGKKVTMVNVWATFCGPCINEMPDLERISKEYADKGFSVIGVVCDVTQVKDGNFSTALLEQAKDIVKQTGVTYRNLLMSDSLAQTELGRVYSVPTTYFLDENGEKIGETYIGSRSYEDWCTIINGLLAE